MSDLIAIETFVALKVTDSQEEALNVFRKYDRTALPVVDSNGVLVGIVTSDDMLDVAEEEATEDIQKLGGMEALDEPYTTIPLLRMVKKRATWLIILFLGEMLTATAMQGYNGEIEKAAILAMFLPLIISSGGNSGSQATTLVIRAMALGELTLRDWLRVVRKEFLSGLSLGLILGSSVSSGSRSGNICTFSITGRITGWSRLPSASRSSGWCSGALSRRDAAVSCCAVADSIRQRPRRRSSPRWSMSPAW